MHNISLMVCSIYLGIQNSKLGMISIYDIYSYIFVSQKSEMGTSIVVISIVGPYPHETAHYKIVCSLLSKEQKRHIHR